MSHMMLESKRASRGKRMSVLVGEAAEEDDTFWNNEVWQEGSDSDAESYEENDADAQPDVFDSDFDDTDDDDDDDEDLEEEKKAVRADKKDGSKASKSQRYAEPKISKRRNPLANLESLLSNGSLPESLDRDEENLDINNISNEKTNYPTKKRKRNESEEFFISRTVRESTKLKTADADVARAQRDEEQKGKTKPTIKPIKRAFKQKELLVEALQTEVQNYKWLISRKYIQDKNIDTNEKPIKTNSYQDFVRYYSRRGKGTFITFSSVECIPKILTQTEPPQPQQLPAKCIITGLPAKYRDPRTMLPYANLAAFKELKLKYHK